MELSDQVIARLRLKSELTEVLVMLEEFVATFFVPKEQKEVHLLFERLPNGVGELLARTFLKEPITPHNEALIKKQVIKLQDKLGLCKVIQLTLAFQPDERTIDLFSEWVKKNVGSQMLIDLQYDRTIIGGALLVAHGIYKDYSVKKDLSNKFQLQKEEIISLLK